MQCDICHKKKEVKVDESGQYCEKCYLAICKKSALDAGIPLSVIEGKTKLTDHFSQEYIDYMCGKKHG
jgi:hypothetical protein